MIRLAVWTSRSSSSFADKAMAIQLFHLVYKQSEDDIPQEEERLGANEMVDRLTKDFVAMVPEREFSPAEISCHF